MKQLDVQLKEKLKMKQQAVCTGLKERISNNETGN